MACQDLKRRSRECVKFELDSFRVVWLKLLNIHLFCHNFDKPDRKNDDHYACGSRLTDIAVFGKLLTFVPRAT